MSKHFKKLILGIIVVVTFTGAGSVLLARAQTGNENREEVLAQVASILAELRVQIERLFALKILNQQGPTIQVVGGVQGVTSPSAVVTPSAPTGTAPAGTDSSQSGTSQIRSEVRFTQTLRQGDSGPAVTQFQQELVRLGYLDAQKVTGTFGPVTRAASRQLQVVNIGLLGFSPDQVSQLSGFVGARTNNLLNAGNALPNPDRAPAAVGTPSQLQAILSGGTRITSAVQCATFPAGSVQRTVCDRFTANQNQQ